MPLTQLRAVIVEDEPLAQRRLTKLLNRIPAVQIVGLAEQGHDALEVIAAARPNLLLLDVEMPEITGFDLLERMSSELKPAVIFVTAFDGYAFKAFAVRAADYVLKPVEQKRLEQALDQARHDIDTRNVDRKLAELRKLTTDLRRQMQARESPYDQELWIQQRSEVVRAAVGDIDWIEAQKDYVRIYSGTQTYFMRASIGAIEERLDPAEFMRVHRSAIIRLDRIRAVARNRYGSIDVKLSLGAIVRVGRKYSAALKQRVSARQLSSG